jgi:acetyltransferase-like isoleucine patch superfamily enzyme
MMKAFNEIGFVKSVQYAYRTLLYLIFRCLVFPQCRSFYLRLCGARIGANCIVHGIRFLNFHRGGFANLTLGKDCFLGSDVLLDLAAPITLGNQVTIAERALVMTHMNVGYKDHPLQKEFQARMGGVTIKSGSFIGAGTIILDGITIGEKSFVGAGSLINGDVPNNSFWAGVPARLIRAIQP